jgi:phage terminase Nu1 subunit (DNA packaging protein)
MNSQELCSKLRITAKHLAEWAAKGIPREKIQGKWVYDEKAVAKWIYEQANPPPPEPPPPAEPTEIIAHTIDEAVAVLRELGMPIDPRTLSRWTKQPKFPGKAGHAGRRDGHFPCRAIIAWAEGNAAMTDDGSGAVTGGPRSRLMVARAELAELMVRQKQGELISRSEALAALHRQASLIITMLEGFPDEAAGMAEGEAAKKIRERLAQRIERLRESLADQLEQEDISQGGEEPSQPTKNKE